MFFFFFKHKTAYDMLISDWSSDVVLFRSDGTFSVDGHGGLGALVDGGDVGDTYNWCPPADDVLVTRPSSVAARVVEAGPVRARIGVVRTFVIYRKSVMLGKRGVVRVGCGGPRHIIKKKTTFITLTLT